MVKVTQAEPSHGFVAQHALVEGYALRSSNDPAIALQPMLATPNGRQGAEREAHSMVTDGG